MTSIVDILTTFYNALKTKFATKEDVKQPDYIQNDSTAADYIKNRPFYTEPTNINITWDGNTTGLTASSKNHYYKVSDLVFTLEQFEAMTFTDNSGSEYLIGSGFIINGNNVLSYGDMGPVIATIDNAGGIPGGWSDIFPEAGVYFPANGWVVSLKGTAENIVKLDNKFLDLSDYSTKADLSDKMDKSNPTGTGSFSLNRKADTTVGDYSFAEGYNNEASGNYSHAEGFETTASSDYSHAEGMGTIAASFNQHIQGAYNIVDAAYADIIGNGDGDAYRSNAATVDWNGNAWYAGDVYVGSTSGTNKDEGSKKLATEEYVDSKQVQHDYNQNDSTAADYIKNRPFYSGDPVESVIIPETTVTFSEKSGLMAATWPENFDLVDGQTYTISWDGTDYVCTGILFNNIPIVGNLAFLGAGEDTGEPFIFVNQGQWAVFSTESATEHVISISEFAVEVVKIDEKYLPEATNIASGIAKIQVRNLDTTKSYSTEEIEEIYKSVRAGAAIYLTYGSVIVDVSYRQNDHFTYMLFNGQENTIRPVDGVWDFTNRETTYRSSVFFSASYSDYAKISCDAFSGVGGNTGSGYELVVTNMSGFGGDYIQADNAIVLKLLGAPYYLYVSANKNGEIEVIKKAVGSASSVDKTTLFKNGDDSMILKSSTEGSNKKFKITVDDTGAISATEVS